jgi:transposase-like protein
MPDLTCLNCGSVMEVVEQSAITGRNMREYRCPKCGKSEVIDRGSSLGTSISGFFDPDKS